MRVSYGIMGGLVGWLVGRSGVGFYPRKASSPNSTPKFSLDIRLISRSSSSSNDPPDPPLAHCRTYTQRAKKKKKDTINLNIQKVRNVATRLALLSQNATSSMNMTMTYLAWCQYPRRRCGRERLGAVVRERDAQYPMILTRFTGEPSAWLLPPPQVS